MPVYSVDTHLLAETAHHAVSASVILATDATAWDDIPVPLRQAADIVWLGAPANLSPRRGCGWMQWRRGEAWLQGQASQLRMELAIPARRYFVPIHYAAHGAGPGAGSGATGDTIVRGRIEAAGFPGLELPALDLLGLEPRWFSDPKGESALQDSIDFSVRLGARRHPVPGMEAGADGAEIEPWQRLRAALELEWRQPGGGVPMLAELSRDETWHPVLRSLCLRDLIVALMQGHAWDAAGELLSQARTLYPGYRELAYLAAIRELALGRGAEAVSELWQATESRPKPGDVPFIGSGGEGGYRAHYLLAALAEQTGRQAVALHHFLTGAAQTPAFPPAVAGVLRQRLPPDLLAGAQWTLSALARREPAYQLPVFNFFLLHQAWNAAGRALRSWPVAPEIRTEMERSWQSLAPLRQSTPRPAGAVGVILSGPLQVHSSVASINRQIAAALEADGRFLLALDPTAAAEELVTAFPAAENWAAGLRRLPHRLDLTLRHGFPPDFSRPSTGKLAMILPWEFGAIPRQWCADAGHADRIFVPSRFVREVLVRAGMKEERIRVIPNGVDTARYRPEGAAWRPPQSRAVEFLFVGGAIQRKGMDVLLRAWREAFAASDDVSLVIKELGGKSFYRHLSLANDIRALAADPGAAPVIHLDEDWGEPRMPDLYRGCDALVLPYRGEGFGLPLAEALACGKPVIATGAGPAPEFCPPEASWLLPAEETTVPAAMWPPGEMSGDFTWFEPSLDHFVAALREAARLAPGGELARRGTAAVEPMRKRYDWALIRARYREELADLLDGDLVQRRGEQA